MIRYLEFAWLRWKLVEEAAEGVEVE